MNKIFTLILLMGFWTTATAGGVINSETVDFESDSEYCKTLVTVDCLKRNKETSKSFIFNPAQKGGKFQVVDGWYMNGTSFKFIPVPQYR